MDPRLWMFERMTLSRRYEAAIKLAYLEGKQPRFNMANGPIPGEMHLSDGQEPCAAGVCVHLRPSDFVSAPHRAHHIAIAKGVDLNAMTAEIFGRREGLSGGRGGHMHLFDERVSFASSGIVAQGMAPALGAALAAKLDGRDDVAVAFIGEGAANQGAFHETLNLAAVWRAPLIVIIEDNGYGVSVAKAACTAIASNAVRAASYGMPGVSAAGNDPDVISAAAAQAIARARAGGGPSLIEIETYRLEGHFMGDVEQYRPPGEVDALKARDPLLAYRSRLTQSGVAEARLSEIEARCAQAVDDSMRFARAAAPPRLEEAYAHVFA